MNRNEQLAKSRLGRLLVNRGYISEQQLAEALKIQADEGLLLGEVLLSQGLITETNLKRVLKHQKRYRYTAAVVALVAAPFQPMVAMAATPIGLPIANANVSLSSVQLGSLGGLKAMDDEELAGVNAQGLAPGIAAGLGLGQNADAVSAGLQHKYRDDEDYEEQDEEQIAYELADTVLTMAGVGPISNFLEAKVTVEGVKYQEGRPAMEILEGGRMKFYMPASIDRISMEDIRVKGSTSGDTMGSIYMSDIKWASGSNYIIGAK